MKRKLILIAATLTFAAADPTLDTAAAFSKLKTLVGKWEANTPKGKDHLTYELIGAGTVLIERETATDRPEMLTAYHLDGKRLLLTHYCMAGNQPRMQAQFYDSEKGELQFRFLDATNLANPNAGHMHNVSIRFVDNDHLLSTWEFYENGKSKFNETFEYTRVH